MTIDANGYHTEFSDILYAIRDWQFDWLPNLPSQLKRQTVALLKQHPFRSEISKSIVFLAGALEGNFPSPAFYICRDNQDILIENVLFSADRYRGTNYTVRRRDGFVVVAIANGAIPDDVNQVPRLPHTYVTEAMENSGLTILIKHTDIIDAFKAIISLFSPEETTQ